MAISTVSFNKTPQAGDDLFNTTEDSSLVMDLDVMANDLGGAAKKLYSIDDGTNSGSMSDLLTKDVAGVVEHSAQGALISIVNGKIHYDGSALSAQLQSMQEGEVFTDSFTYAIQMANGTLSWATATIKIAGVNDAASMSGSTTGAVTEDGPLTSSGTLNVVDPDHDQSHTQTATNANSSLGTYSVDANGHWSYAVDNAAVQHLAEGAQTTDSFVVTSLDGTASKTVTITITGVNDAASITGDTSGSGAEDATSAVTGSLTVSDVDDGQAHAQAGTTTTANGTFVVDADGNWSYAINSAAVQHLNSHESVTEHFTVASQDGSAHQAVDITIVGDNDAASISGSSSGSAAEDQTAAVTGTLAVSDVDDGEAHSVAGSGTTDHGSWSVDADGNWSFAVNNAAVQHLNAHETATDTFVVSSVDGTASQTVSVTIQGDNDNASVGGSVGGSVSEDGTVSASGTATVSDVDDGEQAFAAVSGSDLHGTYGDFTFDSSNGAWTYTLRNGDANVQALNTGDTRTDSLNIASLDGTASETISVTINGLDDLIPVSAPAPYLGGGDPNDFDSLGLPGSQTIVGGNQSQTEYGGPANDTLNGSNSGNGGDTLYGGSGNDTLSGNNGSDALYGGSGSDTLNGGNGPDTLVGGYGADSITGGSSGDTVRYLDVLDTGDTIADFAVGSDKIDLSGIDANTAVAGNQAFAWGGVVAGPYVQANSVTAYQSGSNTVILADTNGNVTNAEFSITLTGVTASLLSATDFNTL